MFVFPPQNKIVDFQQSAALLHRPGEEGEKIFLLERNEENKKTRQKPRLFQGVPFSGRNALSNARCGTRLSVPRAMLRPLRPAPTAPRTIQQTPQFPTYALRAQQKDGVARDYGRPSPCLSGAPPNREQIFLSHFPAPGERTAKHASLTDQAPAPPAVHQATNNRFSPFPPRISVRSLTGRSAGLRRSISPPCFGLRQSTLQPFSCRKRNDLSRPPCSIRMAAGGGFPSSKPAGRSQREVFGAFF